MKPGALKIASIVTISIVIITSIALYTGLVPKTIAWYQLTKGTASPVDDSLNAVSLLFGEGPYTNQNFLGLTLVDTVIETKEANTPFAVREATDENFPSGLTYTFPAGQDGIYETKEHEVFVNGRIAKTYTETGRIFSPVIDQVRYSGKKSVEQVQKESLEQWKTLVTSITKKNKESAESLVTAKELENFSKTTSLKDLSYRVAPTAKVAIKIEDETESIIQIGTIQLKQSNCSVSADIPIVYLKDQKVYRFSDVYVGLASLCEKPKPTSGVLNCSNCWLAPVSKQFALKSTYAPYTVATGLNGGGTVTPDTKKALTKLFDAAKSEGISKIRVSSSYRSYTIQTSLFNTYVKNEKNAGLSEAQAIEKANTYSAKPGHSEHQLGTTVDVVACAYPCSFYDSANKPLTQFLLKNAHKFGFVISYPDGSQSYTGYVYEPWHIRYIGVDYATELFNKGYLNKKGYYLYQFLLEKGKY